MLNNVCVLCGHPWFGDNKCTCYLSNYRNKFPEYYTPLHKNVNPKTPSLKFTNVQNEVIKKPEWNFNPTSLDLLNKIKDESNSTTPAITQPKQLPNYDKFKWDLKLIPETNPTLIPDKKSLIETTPEPASWSDVSTISDRTNLLEEAEPEDKLKNDDYIKSLAAQLIKLNELEESNRRKKNRILIDSAKNYSIGPLFGDTKQPDSFPKKRERSRPSLNLSDVTKLSDRCFLDELEKNLSIPEVKKCINPECDHLEEGPMIEVPHFDRVDSLQKIIDIAKTYHCQRNKVYKGIDMERMFSLIEPLEELKQMIGLSENKQKIIEQIVFFLKGYQDHKKKDMMHTVITGPPGTGKTTFARIIGKIYSKLGLVSKGQFVEVTKEDLVGQYIGHTVPKTNETIDKCLGGIMFIDEVYSLGHGEKIDSFSKECLDVLNQRLSESRDMLCIIAGYKEDIENCVFKQNKGLKRRFPFVYDIDGYTSDELSEIFKLKMNSDGWTVANEIVDQIKGRFDKKLFKFYAGDIESFVFRTKITFAQMNFYNETRNIDRETLETVLKYMEEDRCPKETEDEKKRKEHEKYIRETMYL